MQKFLTFFFSFHFQAEIVYLDTDQEFLHPFKEKMDDFFESAEEMLKRQQKKLEDTQNKFIAYTRYLAVKDTTEQMTPETFFGIWASFLEQYRHYWKMEQKRIARDSFEKVQQRKKVRTWLYIPLDLLCLHCLAQSIQWLLILELWHNLQPIG